jgi:thymidine phosphorylase
MARVSAGAGLPCRAMVTDMNQPLASTAGNALEVGEAIDFLSGSLRRPGLAEVTQELSAELLLLGGLADSLESARSQVSSALDSGRAMEAFSRMVRAQGGPADLVERPGHYLAAAPVSRPVFAEYAGFVNSIDTLEVGMTVVELGGGRLKDEDPVDPAVGLSGLCRLGDALDSSSPIATVHARTEEEWRQAEMALRKAVRVSPEPLESGPVLIACYGGGDG